MDKDLNDIALKFEIKSKDDSFESISVDDVVEVLNNLNKSYKNYMIIEFTKENNHLLDPSDKNLLNSYLEQVKLCVVDVKYGSYETALAPNLQQKSSFAYNDDFKKWELSNYYNYKNDIFENDLKNAKIINNLKSKYSDNELKAIIAPLYQTISKTKKYQINIKNSDDSFMKTFSLPHKKVFNGVFKRNKTDIDQNAVMQGYFRVKDIAKGINSKDNIKEVIYFAPVENDVYPFQLEKIKFENTVYEFNRPLFFESSILENQIVFENQEFRIVVWGKDRADAMEALSFSFDSMYRHFALEDDSKLSTKAKIKKNMLLNLVKSDIFNAQ